MPLTRLKPIHMRAITLHWSGFSQREIAQIVGFSEGHVSEVINSPIGQEFLSSLINKTLDTILDVQNVLQAYAPACLDQKVRLALESPDDRVRNIACTDILHMAGHQPVKRVSIERPDATMEKYRTLTEHEIRERILREVYARHSEEKPTVH